LLTAEDFRRHVRPFFFTPDGLKPTAWKPYYDVVSWLTTQLILSFTVVPFIILYFSDTIHVWAHVYFYGILAVAVSMAFFASPGKGFLIRKLKKRNKPAAAARTISQESISHPMLGLPSDPEREFEEAAREITQEIEEMRKRGSTANVPNAQEVRALVEEKLGKKQ
jgi:lysophospholipid acyltransferase